jgi:hypothetical protein
MAGQLELTPEDVAARLRPRDAGLPPQLPASWTAAGLLLPFGDANPTMANYDQLVVANIEYDSTGPQFAMRVSLYLLEDMQYFDFLFVGNEWYWLVSKPGQAPIGLWHSDRRLGRSHAGRANPARYLVFDELQHRCALARAQSRQQQSGEYPDPRLLLHGLSAGVHRDRTLEPALSDTG